MVTWLVYPCHNARVRNVFEVQTPKPPQKFCPGCVQAEIVLFGWLLFATVTIHILWYCWWLKSCTTWNVKKPCKWWNKLPTSPQLVWSPDFFQQYLNRYHLRAHVRIFVDWTLCLDGFDDIGNTHVDVSKNGWFGGTPIFGNTYVESTHWIGIRYIGIPL